MPHCQPAPAAWRARTTRQALECPTGIEPGTGKRRVEKNPPPVPKCKKQLVITFTNCLVDLLARPERFELPTPWFVAKYSIQMSYGRLRGANYTEESCEDKAGTPRELQAGSTCNRRCPHFFCAVRMRRASARASSADTSSGLLSLNNSQSSAPLMSTSATSMYRMAVTSCRWELSPNRK